MKAFLLGLLILLAVRLPAEAGEARVLLSPLPYAFEVPENLASHLSTGPLQGAWAEEVKAAGATAATLVFYMPENGEKVILFSAYLFPAAAWDAAQKPDQPPPFGSAIIREKDMVLSTVGPFDTIYEPGTPDARNVATLAEEASRAASFVPAP